MLRVKKSNATLNVELARLHLEDDLDASLSVGKTKSALSSLLSNILCESIICGWRICKYNTNNSPGDN